MRSISLILHKKITQKNEYGEDVSTETNILTYGIEKELYNKTLLEYKSKDITLKKIITITNYNQEEYATVENKKYQIIAATQENIKEIRLFLAEI